MKKRFFSILLSLCMALTMLPATAFAEDNEGTSVCTCETACLADAMNADCTVCGAEGATVTGCGKYEAQEETPAEEAPAELTAVEKVQLLINALPDADTITSENRADVEEQLTAIDDAKFPLTDEERELLDIAKYDAAIAALNVLDGMGGAEVPTVLDGSSDVVLLIGDQAFTSSGKETKTVGDGTATFDPSTSTLTLNNITLTFAYADAVAIESEVSNLKINLIGTNTINIAADGMAGIWQYGGGSATIKGAAGSKLIINSSGKNNVGITTAEGVSLTLTDTNLTINDNTATASAKGYMVGLKPNGDFTMSGGSYTANGVQSGIEMYTNYAANLSGVNFNITSMPRQSFDADDLNTMSFGLNLAPLTGRQNVIENCSGSVSAHYPLYVDGSTALNNSSSLTLTTDDYDAVFVNADLTVSGGTLNLASTGSSGNGFYVLKSSKLAFKNSPNVTIKVGYVAVYLSGNSATAEISSGTLKTTAKAGVLLSKSGNTFTFVNGTLEMIPKTGESAAIGIQSNGTVSIEGGSLKTSAGMYSAIQNIGEKTFSFSGGTHTLSTSTGSAGYVDTANGVLNISGTADVTFDGWNDGMRVLGALNLSGGKLTVRNAGEDGIYTTGTLNLTGGTLNTSGTRLGVLAGNGGQVNFSGTDATLIGGTAGWGKTEGTGTYHINGGKVVLQGGSYAASTIYSSLAEGYHVYAGSSESDAPPIDSPSISTFTGKKYVRIENVASYTLTLVNVEGATSASHVEGANLSYTAADAPSEQHFAYWEMKVGDGEAVRVGTDSIYTGKMPAGDATLTAVYEYCSGGTATCQAKAKCSVCSEEYGILAAHSFTAEVVDEKYEITPATCTSAGTYYKSCPLCGASSEHWNNATFSVPALSHTESGWKKDADSHWKECTECGTTTNVKTAHTPNIAAPTETEAQVCTVCGYVIAPSLNHTHILTKVEAKAPTCVDNGVKTHYVCSACGKLFADAVGSVETNADAVVDKATGRHNYEWVVDKEPTATEKGSKHEECTVCHDKKDAVEIPATGLVGDINELQALVNAGGTVTLQKNYNINSTLTISNTVTLDLNGYVIKMTGKGSVITLGSSGNLTLKDSSPTSMHSGEYASLPAGGVITGGTGRNTGATYIGGGVYVNGGTFTMDGGTITKCMVDTDMASYGGGVYVVGGTFTMNGGKITDCDCKSSFSKGIHVGANGTFTIAGSAVVNGSVYLYDGTSKMIANGGILSATVYSYGTITRTATEISADTYTTFSGGVGYFWGTMHFMAGTIEDNAKLTVTFDSNGGSDVEAGKVLKGQKVGKPADPIKDDYTFLGWCQKVESIIGEWEINQETGQWERPTVETYEAYSFDQTVTEDITLYAKWEAVPCFTFTVDISTTVKQSGNTAPGEATFTVEPLSDELPDAFENITISGGSVVTNGENTYSAQLTITGTLDDLRACFAEGMYFRQKNDGLENWTYDDTVWALWLIENDVSILSDSLEDSTYTMVVYPVVCEEAEEGERYYYTDLDVDPVEQMRFTNTYTKNIHVHDYQQKYDKDQHWDECACGDKQNIEAHKFGEWKVTRNATETAVGEKERVCSVCEYKETVEIAKLTQTDSPKTGDNSNLTLWFTLLAVSAAGVIGTGMYGKKKRRTR